MTDLSDLKIGDTVVYHLPRLEDIRELRTVTKIGNFINISLDLPRRLNFRFNGTSVGYEDGRIERFSQSEWDAYCRATEVKKMRRKVAEFSWSKANATDALVRQVHALIFGEGGK